MQIGFWNVTEKNYFYRLRSKNIDFVKNSKFCKRKCKNNSCFNRKNFFLEKIIYAPIKNLDIFDFVIISAVFFPFHSYTWHKQDIHNFHSRLKLIFYYLRYKKKKTWYRKKAINIILHVDHWVCNRQRDIV